MRNTVVSLPAADEALARIWTNAADPQTVAEACDKIDDVLRHHADRVGVPSRGKWVFTVPPLAVEFTFSPDDCLVTIHDYLRVG